MILLGVDVFVVDKRWYMIEARELIIILLDG